MAEWLTHILLAYALCTTLGWVADWLDERWVAIGVVGSILPDLDRFSLIVGSDLITNLTGVPFYWSGLHTVGGVVLLSAIGGLLFRTRTQQRRAFGLLLTGAVSHLLVDLPQRYADGRMLTNKYLFPLPPWRPPTPGWYVSADRWVVWVALAVALGVYLIDSYRTQTACRADQ